MRRLHDMEAQPQVNRLPFESERQFAASLHQAPIGVEEFVKGAPERVFAMCDFASIEDRQRLIHSHGQTTADEVYKVLYGALDRVVDLVLFPESQEDGERIIQLAGQHDVCLVPYGGGTSVSCALQLPQNETRSIVAVDMRRMDKILWIDHENFRAGVQAGIYGKDLEARLERVGYTSGHEPDSLELSTLGGWIATNASGMKKTGTATSKTSSRTAHW